MLARWAVNAPLSLADQYIGPEHYNCYAAWRWHRLNSDYFIRRLTSADVESMRAMLHMFGVAFNDVDSYDGKIESLWAVISASSSGDQLAET